LATNDVLSDVMNQKLGYRFLIGQKPTLATSQ